MSADRLKKILEDYDKKCDLYESFTEKMHTLIEELLKENGISVHSVTCRIKDRDKLEEKVRKSEDKYEKLEDITDISGLRIITYFSDDVDFVAEIINKEFVIDTYNSIDKREIMHSDQFGYLSLHYVVSLNKEREKLTEYKRFKDCKCEVQIRSILQHAWAEIEHDMGYKTHLEVPWQIRRRFTRIAGLLEVADSEFVTIKENLALYASTINQKIVDEPEKVYIDKLSLKSFINESNLIKEINQQIVNETGLTILSDDSWDSYSDLLKELFLLGVKTISELELKLIENREVLTKWAVNWMTPEQDEPEDTPKYFLTETPIFYLNYCLIAKTGSIEYIINFLNVTRSGIGDKENFAKEIIVTYNTIIKNLMP